MTIQEARRIIALTVCTHAEAAWLPDGEATLAEEAALDLDFAFVAIGDLLRARYDLPPSADAMEKRRAIDGAALPLAGALISWLAWNRYGHEIDAPLGPQPSGLGPATGGR